MAREKTTAERGRFKKEINAALYKSEEIRDLLLGDTSGMTPAMIQKAFKEHVKSHLFIDDTITDATTYIFYDISIPEIHPETKTCNILMYLICARDILDNYSREGYVGDRIDILAQMVEDALVEDKEVAEKFGIGGNLDFDSIGIYNSTRYYGCVLSFVVPTFRHAA